MRKSEERKRIRGYIQIAVIAALCAFTVLLDVVDIPFSQDEFYDRMICKIIQQSCGSVAGILLLLHLGIRLFDKPQNFLYMLPCLIIAVDNFQFSAYFRGKMQLVRTAPQDFIIFFVYCMLTGLFEEIVFRGIVFAVIAGLFSKDKKGFLWTYAISSLVFGLSHLFNGFSAATLLQVGYTILTGGLFAFCLIKTKNILCCALTHGIFNFCGMLFDKQGLGTGVVFDGGTIITMVAVSVLVGVFVLYKVWKYPEGERGELYGRLGLTERIGE